MFCEEIIREYTDEPVKEIRKLEGGHINSSFLVLTSKRYVLQKLNRGLYKDSLDTLEYNYLQYKAACSVWENIWDCPEWQKDREGRFFHQDDEGNIWRMYIYIPSGRESRGSVPVNDHELGKGLAKLHGILKNCEGIKAAASMENLHDLKFHYGRYLKQTGPDMERDAGLDRIINERIEELMHVDVPGKDVIHGDAKLSNMIINDSRVTGFIDLDTMTTGSRYDDLADCARSCCLRDDGSLDESRLTDLLSGYEKGAGGLFADINADLLKRNLEKNIFMLGLRYYTDHLSKEGYFAERYKGQNLDKAKGLLKS